MSSYINTLLKSNMHMSPCRSASTLFRMLNSTYGFSHYDWLNSNTRFLFSFNPSLQ